VSGFSLGNATNSGSTGNIVGPPLSITGITVKVETAPGASKNYTFTLHRADNGTDTTATCQVSGTATSATCAVSGVTTPANAELNWKIDRTSSNAPGWVLITLAYG
jgi:hypothetical protein